MNSRKFIDLTLFQHQFDYQPNFKRKANTLIYFIQNTDYFKISYLTAPRDERAFNTK